MSTREQLLKMQRIMLRQLKTSVERLEGTYSPQVERYLRTYSKELRNYSKVSSKKNLLNDLKKADIIFGADFHAFNQSQRTHIRLLRELIKQKRPIVLALEFVTAKDQEFLDKFVSGRIKEKTFLKKINYAKNWGFPWENYRIIFEFAKSHGLACYGINKKTVALHNQLEERDVFSAKQIADIFRRHRGAIIYVIYGDLHMAKAHLPGHTVNELKEFKNLSIVRIFQNSENLYFKLAQKGLENRVEVLQVKDNTYCIVNSPPWSKWQAYLNQLDLDSTQPDIDTMNQYVHMIAKQWRITRIKRDFNLFNRGDARIFQYLSPRVEKKAMSVILKDIRSQRSFFVPSPATFYLSSPEPHHLAELAGLFVHSRMRKDRRVLTDFPKDFLVSVWIEAFGYFASLMFNPHRKLKTLNGQNFSKGVTLIVLEYKLRERLSEMSGKPLTNFLSLRRVKYQDFVTAARVAGAHLGLKIFYGFRKNRISISTLHGWLAKPSWRGENMGVALSQVLWHLKNVQIENQMLRERL